MYRYYKLVCLTSNPDWFLREFRAGRLRFGWSPPGTDLRAIRSKPPGERSRDERATWGRSQFLLNLRVGDRVVVQFEQPLRSIVVGEVCEPLYDFATEVRDDFNHILHVRPLVAEPVPVNIKAVSAALHRKLSIRGAHREIYPEYLREELDAIVAAAEAGTLDRSARRTDSDTLERTLSRVQSATIRAISEQWPREEFETLCKRLCSHLEYVEVSDPVDHHQGWDFRVRILDPITGTDILADNVPVQCKNYRGPVTDVGPIDDLARCIKGSGSEIRRAFLFIMGDITPEFRAALEQREEELRELFGPTVMLTVIDQVRIAELYLSYVSSHNDGTERAD